jgi:hypothetical protein
MFFRIKLTDGLETLHHVAIEAGIFGRGKRKGPKNSGLFTNLSDLNFACVVTHEVRSLKVRCQPIYSSGGRMSDLKAVLYALGITLLVGVFLGIVLENNSITLLLFKS